MEIFLQVKFNEVKNLYKSNQEDINNGDIHKKNKVLREISVVYNTLNTLRQLTLKSNHITNEENEMIEQILMEIESMYYDIL